MIKPATPLIADQSPPIPDMLSQHRFVLLIGLAAIWCLLSGHYRSLLLSLGALSCLVSYGFYQKIAQQTKVPRLRFHPAKQFRYTIWLLGEIIASSVDVIGAIFNSRKVSPQFFDLEVGDLDEMGRVIYANSITRTPGTVSVDVQPTTIRVHALLVSAKDELLTHKMRAKIHQLATDK